MPRAAALSLGAAATIVLGVLLPLAMAPASKSSPLLLAIAAALSAAALLRAEPASEIARRARAALTSSAGVVFVLLYLLMALSILWSHDRAASVRQLLQFSAPLLAGAVIVFAFPAVADRRRAIWWPLAAAATACLVTADLWTGLTFRDLVGGRVQTYAYNRPIVTLVVLALPIMALVAAHRRPWLALLLLPLPVVVSSGESATAVLALAAAVLVLPGAWLLPRVTRIAGLAATLAVLAASPVIGTLAERAIGKSMHQAMASAHSDDRVAIWLSFESAAQRRLLIGNGFGSSLNMQHAPVAREIPPERVTLLGASHPHNAFLQLWVELGASGAALAAALFVFWYRWIGRTDPLLQPFLLAWTAVITGVALVSHGAWQAWWAAAIAAGAAGFLAIARELRSESIVKQAGAA